METASTAGATDTTTRTRNLLAVNSPAPLSLPERLRQLARERSDADAVTLADTTLSRAELVGQANALAAHLQSLGVQPGDYVSIVLPNCVECVVATFATWFVGGIPQPLSPKLSTNELHEILKLTQPAAVIGYEMPGGPVTVGTDFTALPSAGDLPDAVSPAWKAPTSGGSTGRPKVIVANQPAVYDSVSGFAGLFGLDETSTALITAPMSHNGPFMVAHLTILAGGHAVLMPRFDAEEALRLIQAHRVTWVYAVPTMMGRIVKLPDDVRASYDVSSIAVWMHMAAPCPPAVKEHFIEWLGPQVIRELYAGTEAQAGTLLDGNEWLTHRGSVGRVMIGEIEIRDDSGAALSTGEVGHVWMRRGPDAPTPYYYLGAEATVASDGWESLGDVGWMDADGYLYLGDRDSDMILVGGSNVYPAEVEAALLEHPSVEDACVIGLPDDDLGSAPHALVKLSADVDDDEFREFLRDRLAPYKQPRSIERVDHVLRDDAGKIRRSALRAERLT